MIRIFESYIQQNSLLKSEYIVNNFFQDAWKQRQYSETVIVFPPFSIQNCVNNLE